MGYPGLVRYAKGCGLTAALALAGCGSDSTGFNDQALKNTTQDGDIHVLQRQYEYLDKRVRDLEWGGGVMLPANERGFSMMGTRMGWFPVSVENVSARGDDTSVTLGFTNTTSITWNKCRFGYQWGKADANEAVTFATTDVTYIDIRPDLLPGTRTDVTISMAGTAPSSFNRISLTGFNCNGLRSR